MKRELDRMDGLVENSCRREDRNHSVGFNSNPVALYPRDAAVRIAVPSPDPKSTKVGR